MEKASGGTAKVTSKLYKKWIWQSYEKHFAISRMFHIDERLLYFDVFG